MNGFWAFRRFLGFLFLLVVLASLPVKFYTAVVEPAQLALLSRVETRAQLELVNLAALGAVFLAAVATVMVLPKLPGLLERLPFFNGTILWNPAYQPAPVMPGGRKRMTLEPVTGHFSLLLALMGVAAGVAVIVVGPGENEPPGILWVMGTVAAVMTAGGIAGFICMRRWAVEYDDFALKWMPESGRPVVFAWEDILAVDYRQEWTLRLTGGRKVKVSDYAIGSREFLWKLQARTGLKVPNLSPALKRSSVRR